MSSKSRFRRVRRQSYFDAEIDLGGDKPEEFRFYPCSLSMAARLRDFGGDLVAQLGKLHSMKGDAATRSGIHTEMLTDPAGGTIEKQIIDPPDAERVIRVAEEVSRAWHQLTRTLTSEANLLMVAELLLDSLRDETSPADFHPETGDLLPDVVREFYKELDARTVFEMLPGWFRANAGEFGELGKTLQTRAKEVLDRALNPSSAETELTPEEQAALEEMERENVVPGPGSQTTSSGEPSSREPTSCSEPATPTGSSDEPTSAD